MTYLGQNGVNVYLLSLTDSLAQTIVYNDAVAGATINDQLTTWKADTRKSKYDFITVEIGLNDLDPSESAAIALGRYQILIDSINLVKKSTAVVVAATMTPCKTRLITVYGATNGLVAYQKWLDMNDAIMGNGANAITGVTYRVNSHTASLNDGAGNLAGAYDTGDGIHENNAGRLIIANAYRVPLIAAGILFP